MALTKFTEKLISDSFKASISGSDTTESSSFASRVTLVEGGTTSKTLVSSSAQIADDISGSLSSTAIASLGASIVSASVLSSPSQGTIRLATNGVNTDVDSGLQAVDSPTFAAGTITGDLSVGGTLTAQEVHTEFESASILFTSGSTQFGNSSDDVHEFKGNVISGSSTSTASLAMISLADKIEHIGDTNNTIEFGTDEIKLRTGGGSRLIARDSNVELYNDLVVAGAATFNEDSGDKDFRIESNDNTHMFFVDGGNNRIGIGVGASPAFATLDIDAPGATNADNLDQSVDRATLRVRYRTDETDDGMFFGGLGSSAGYIQGVIDASNDNTSQAGKTIAINPYGGNVGIGTNNVSELLHLYSTTSNSPNILIQNENDSAGEAGNAGGIEFYLKDDNGGNPDFQDLGIIRWTGHDKDNPYNKFTAAAITGSADDPGNSSGRIDFGVAYSDSMINAMTIRAASSGVSRVGIGTNNPDSLLDLYGDNKGLKVRSADYTIAYLGNAGSSGAGLDRGMVILYEDGNTNVELLGEGSLMLDDRGDNVSNLLMKATGAIDHGMSAYDDGDVWHKVTRASNEGGVQFVGYSERKIAIEMVCRYNGDENSGYDSSGQSTSTQAPINIVVQRAKGTSIAAVPADKNLLSLRNNTTTRFIFNSNGTAYAGDSWTTISDKRVKKDIKDIPYGLDEINKLEPKIFTRYDGDFDDEGNVVLDGDGKKQIGFIAQEIKEVVPEMIANQNQDLTEGFYVMDDGKLTSVLVKAVQELSQKNEALEKRIEELEK